MVVYRSEVNLAEAPSVVRQVSDFADALETQGNDTLLEAIEDSNLAPAAEESKARTCGLRILRRSVEAEQHFSRILQKMIRRALTSSEEAPQLASLMGRLRIFEDHTFPFILGNGESASFVECRALQFRRLRAAAGISEADFVSSLCDHPFQGQSGQGGKSGALFLKSHDDRYILKTIEEHEFACLKDILPNYLLYLEENKSSLLSRFYGAFALSIGRVTLRVVAMRNCLKGKQAHIYDLKGTTEDRWVDPSMHAVLKDNNFIPYTMRFDNSTAKRLVAIIRDDADFLESCGLMDYSLLVGVSSSMSADIEQASDSHAGWLHSSQEPYVPCTFQLGIIDYLQRWTPKKVAAHWLKKFTIGCVNEIDTEPPAVYCARFYKYFTTKILPKG